MKNNLVGLFLGVLLFLTCSSAYAYVIIAVEEGNVNIMNDNKPRWTDEARNKQYFEIDEDKKTVTRVKVEYLVDTFTYKKGHIEPDNTVYQIFGPTSVDSMNEEKVIHGAGQPGTHAVELITIGKDYVLQSLHAGNYVTVRKSKIVETSGIN